MNRFREWGVSHSGLFTFPHSPKHIHLYQKFDFWPRFLTPLMAKSVTAPASEPRWSRYSDERRGGRQDLLQVCRALTGSVYAGLDLEREIVAVEDQKLGDTVLLWDGPTLAGLAVCHCGPGTEAGFGACYVKFGTVRPGAGEDFERLLDACEALAAVEGMSRLVAGVNMSHHDAYRRLMARGFRTEMEGIAMQSGNEAGYHRPDVYLLDDWR